MMTEEPGYEVDETTPLIHNKKTIQEDDPVSGSGEEAPLDRYNLAYIIFFIQGIGMLLPWNFFITANDYFRFKFAAEATLRDKFENVFSIAAMIPNILSVVANIYLTPRTSSTSRIVPSLLIMACGFIVTSTFVYIDTASWTFDFFILTIVTLVISNMGTGIFQGAIFGVAAVVGQKYTQALMMGQAWAGILAALASILSQLGNGDVRQSGFVYFMTATVVILISFGSFCALYRLPVMKFSFERVQRHRDRDNKLANENQAGSSKAEMDGVQVATPYGYIIKKIAPICFSILLNFVVTLACFPGIAGNIRSTVADASSSWARLFSPVAVFLVFNVGDLAGRTLILFYMPFSPRGWALHVCVVLRIAFVPLFMMCNYQPRVHTGVVFANDWVPVLLNVLFSFSNGYLGSACMMFAPRLVELQHAELAGTIAAFFLVTGLFIGAMLSLALVMIM